MHHHAGHGIPQRPKPSFRLLAGGILMTAPLLKAEGLIKRFGPDFTAVNKVSLEVAPGETLGIVGESGSGKSTLLRLLNGLHSADAGSIRFRDSELVEASTSELRKARRHMHMIFQDPYACLNPRMRVDEILAEPSKIHKHPKADRLPRIREMLDAVQLPASSLRRYPHEFSGGQRQRIGIARSLMLRPELVLADEPVASLDVSVQAQVLNLLKELQKEFGCAMIFVAHDLPVVQYISDRIAVMKTGEIVETLPAKDLFDLPQHPYTRNLVDAVPKA
jgi:ABC-type glutathione transport system ATPase component